jgi:hypothetical protein
MFQIARVGPNQHIARCDPIDGAVDPDHTVQCSQTLASEYLIGQSETMFDKGIDTVNSVAPASVRNC